MLALVNHRGRYAGRSLVLGSRRNAGQGAFPASLVALCIQPVCHRPALFFRAQRAWARGSVGVPPWPGGSAQASLPAPDVRWLPHRRHGALHVFDVWSIGQAASPRGEQRPSLDCQPWRSPTRASSGTHVEVIRMSPESRQNITRTLCEPKNLGRGGRRRPKPPKDSRPPSETQAEQSEAHLSRMSAPERARGAIRSSGGHQQNTTTPSEICITLSEGGGDFGSSQSAQKPAPAIPAAVVVNSSFAKWARSRAVHVPPFHLLR